jgi:hypothetical protein
MKKYLSCVVVILLITLSCTKVAMYEPDTVKPVIKVFYPLDNPAIDQGYPLCMKVLITDNRSLVDVWLLIDDGHGFKKTYPVTGRSIEIIEKYTAPADTRGQLSAWFYATDDAGNMSAEEIRFVMNNQAE